MKPTTPESELAAEREAFIEAARRVVLDALDGLALETTGNANDGPKDGELSKLFAGIDPIAGRMFDKSQA